ncbi:hypothetical protein [Azospirillum sp. B506]|uniref:hypothetical protein n=1 Tax=Azospirillum sp. B506 TaxID=137721 RepID=UPI00034DC580|nr:hypothetical protein [Azospirillum sp. B506]
MAPRKAKTTCEFGDFQTPDELASKALTVLKETGLDPASVVELTCGRGAFVIAADDAFPGATILAGEVNEQYVAYLKERILKKKGSLDNITISNCNFFETDWSSEIEKLQEPLLITGNYPWVTSAALGAIQSSNLPKKSNFHGYAGLDAIMGKSNFDISEWMILRNLDWLNGRHGAIAMLCKTSVARKILSHAWRNKLPVNRAAIYAIDAMASFGAAVDACFFVLEIAPEGHANDCAVFDSLDSRIPENKIGFHDGMMVSDVDGYLENRHLCGNDPHYVWRSGIKHDCSRIMELTYTGSEFLNGNDEEIDIEDSLLYPMLKSSDLGGKRKKERKKYMIVTQRSIGDSTSYISESAPKTWSYLQENSSQLNARASSIYKGKPEFSIFGVGDYTFMPWKVAISGFYKNLEFKVVGPSDSGKPVVFDDTVYFLACWSEEEAHLLHRLLMSKEAQNLLSSMTFWNDKRPITVDLLKRLNLGKVAKQAGLEQEYMRHALGRSERNKQMTLSFSSAAE